MSSSAAPLEREPLTIYPARRVITMDESLPEASAIAVAGDRIVAVGDMDSMAPWREGRKVSVDERLREKILLPGFIDNHIHPFLGALMLPCEIIAPESWRLPEGTAEAVTTAEEYVVRLRAALAARRDKDDWFVTWGYHESFHGRLRRADLDAIDSTRPIVLWQRSAHELVANTRALEKSGLSETEVAGHAQISWRDGHFFENGRRVIMQKLLPRMLKPDWYDRGLALMAYLMHQGGITTAGDMAFGWADTEYEYKAYQAVIEARKLPLRTVSVPHAYSIAQLYGKPIGGGKSSADFVRAQAHIEGYFSRATPRMRFPKAVKLYADGAMFSQLMMMNLPGYIDGHAGQWMMEPELLSEAVRHFWKAGYQIHVHVNGDGGVDAVIAALDAALRETPRFDHRFTLHHLGFHTSAQTRRLVALGAVASVNPYFIHALADSYSILGLGRERASQIVRAGSLARAGIPVSLHSDFMMAPCEPLLLAWCAANRITRAGDVVSPAERLTLEQALRGITIDAAFALGMDHEIGSIAAGKKADFTVLERDPFEAGAAGLKDIPIWGTVFDGQVHPLANPVASAHARAMAEAVVQRPRLARRTRGYHYRAIARSCCPAGEDRCDSIRELASWMRDAIFAGRYHDSGT